MRKNNSFWKRRNKDNLIVLYHQVLMSNVLNLYYFRKIDDTAPFPKVWITCTGVFPGTYSVMYYVTRQVASSRTRQFPLCFRTLLKNIKDNSTIWKHNAHLKRPPLLGFQVIMCYCKVLLTFMNPFDAATQQYQMPNTKDSSDEPEIITHDRDIVLRFFGSCNKLSLRGESFLEPF